MPILLKLRYAPPTLLILAGLAAVPVWSIHLIIWRVGVFDTVGFSTADYLEAHAALQPSRPATDADLTGGPITPTLPPESYEARDGHLNTTLHSIHFTILIDREHATRDIVIRLNPQLRLGPTAAIVAVTTLIPILIGAMWLTRIRRAQPSPLGSALHESEAAP
jgi:hypothetical protein